jgi:hypothetical protein
VYWVPMATVINGMIVRVLPHYSYPKLWVIS